MISRALPELAPSRTITLFSETMTLLIEKAAPESWTVSCRPIPLPPPNAIWKTLPQFSFTIGRPALERARLELGELTKHLRG